MAVFLIHADAASRTELFIQESSKALQIIEEYQLSFTALCLLHTESSVILLYSHLKASQKDQILLGKEGLGVAHAKGFQLC